MIIVVTNLKYLCVDFVGYLNCIDTKATYLHEVYNIYLKNVHNSCHIKGSLKSQFNRIHFVQNHSLQKSDITGKNWLLCEACSVMTVAIMQS